MDLLKYIIVAVIALLVGLGAWVMGNLLSGILVFLLIIGSYVMFNIVKDIQDEPPSTPPVDN
jgi:hypothetical protein